MPINSTQGRSVKKIVETPARQLLQPEEDKDTRIKILEKELKQASETIRKQEEEITFLKTQLTINNTENKKILSEKSPPLESLTDSDEKIRTPTTSRFAPPSSVQTKKIQSSYPDLKHTASRIGSASFAEPSIVQALNFQTPKEAKDKKENVYGNKIALEYKTKKQPEAVGPLLIENPIFNGAEIDDKNEFLDQLDQLFIEPNPKNIIYSENQPDLYGHQYLFALDRSFWPILPMGYHWLIEPGKWPIIKKYKDFPDDQKIEFVIYGPNKKGQVNYLTLINDTTVQSYANSRNPTTYESKKNNDIGVAPEDGRHLDAGHCVDQKDTMDEKIENIDHLSINDPLNIIPEPATWNQKIRNHLVRWAIRENDGAYMQRIYYDDCHLYKFSSEDKAFRFNKGEAQQVNVPSGVYFSAINSTRTEFDWILDVSWQYPFGKIKYEGGKKNKLPQYQRALNQLQIPESAHMPVSLTQVINTDAAIIDEKMAIYQANICRLQTLPTEREIKNKEYLKHAQLRCRRALFEQLYRAAETEIFPFYQFNLSLMCAQLGDIRNASLYLNRATTGLGLMEDNFATLTEGVPLISKSTFTFFQQMSLLHPELDRDDKNQEIWRKQVLS